MENLPKALIGVDLLRWIATYPVDKVICSLNNCCLLYIKNLTIRLIQADLEKSRFLNVGVYCT